MSKWREQTPAINQIRIQPYSNGGCAIERYFHEGYWFRPDWNDAGMPSLNAIFHDHSAALAALTLPWPCKIAPAGFAWFGNQLTEVVR